MKKEQRTTEQVDVNEAAVTAEQVDVNEAAVTAEQVDVNEAAVTAEQPQEVTHDVPFSEVEKKAKRILMGKLPNLSKHALNFEKRSGNFFRASIEKQYVLADDGLPKIGADGTQIPVLNADGTHKEVIRRIVVPFQNEDGTDTELYAEVRDEVQAKRSAALVLDIENILKDKEERRAKLTAEIAEIDRQLDIIGGEYEAACEYVASFDMPEKVAMRTSAVSAAKERADRAEAEAAKLRQMLIDMGIDPDSMA